MTGGLSAAVTFSRGTGGANSHKPGGYPIMLRLPFPAGARGGDSQQPAATDVPPARILHIELSQPIPSIERVEPATGRQYGHAFVLARLHGRPLGVTTLELPATGLTPRQHAQALWSVVRKQAQAHLLEDGLPVFAELDERGLPLASTPWCIEKRRALLRRAPFATVIVATRDRPESRAICLEHLLALEYPADVAVQDW